MQIASPLSPLIVKAGQLQRGQRLRDGDFPHKCKCPLQGGEHLLRLQNFSQGRFSYTQAA